MNPDSAAHADLCGGRGFVVRDPDARSAVLAEALAVRDGPSLVEIPDSARPI